MAWRCRICDSAELWLAGVEISESLRQSVLRGRLNRGNISLGLPAGSVLSVQGLLFGAALAICINL